MFEPSYLILNPNSCGSIQPPKRTGLFEHDHLIPELIAIRRLQDIEVRASCNCNTLIVTAIPEDIVLTRVLSIDAIEQRVDQLTCRAEDLERYMILGWQIEADARRRHRSSVLQEE